MSFYIIEKQIQVWILFFKKKTRSTLKILTNPQVSSGIEAVSLFPAAAILWVQTFWVYICRILRSSHSAPHNSSVTRHRGNLSNNALNRHLVGTLTSHWRPLFSKLHLLRNLPKSTTRPYNKLSHTSLCTSDISDRCSIHSIVDVIT